MGDASKIRKSGVLMRKNHIVGKFFPVLFGGCVLAALTYYKMKFGVKLMESDSASDILYAYLLTNEGKLVSNNWYFSTELRILDNELLFALLFKMFPELSWWTIETIGTAIMNVIMGLASVLIAYKLELGYKSLWMFGFALLPYGKSEYYYVLMHGCGYYVFAIIEVFIILSLFLAGIDCVNKNKFQLVMVYICYLGLSLLIGMQGIRLLANLYAPLLLTSIILFMYDFFSDKNIFSIKKIIFMLLRDKRVLLAVGGMCMAMAGYSVNILALAKRYTWQQFNNLHWKAFSIDPVLTFFSEIFSNLGYIEEWGGVFSFGEFANLFSLVIFALILFSLVTACKKACIAPKDRFIICFFCLALLLHLFIYIFLQEKYKPRYMLPFFMLFPHIIALMLKYWKNSIRKIVILIFTVCSIVTSINTVYFWYFRENHQSINIDKQKEMTDFLVDKGYEYGFATFWYCNSSIQLSDGKLAISPLRSANKFEKYEWLCPKEGINYEWNDKIFLSFQMRN